jgi:hypothetical protein
MAIKVQWESDGPFAICDNVAEAAALLRAARTVPNGASHAQPKEPDPKGPEPKGAEEKINIFFQNTNDKGRLLMKTLLNYPAGIEGDKLIKELQIDASGLGGIVGSLSKAANKAKIGLGQFVVSEARFEGKRRYRWMAPGKLLRDQMGRF